MENTQRKQQIMAATTTELMDLPWGIICDIISKLPPKSIGKAMCVSKNFQTLKKDPYFLNLHVNYSITQLSHFIVKENPILASLARTLFRESNPGLSRYDPARTLFVVGDDGNVVEVPIAGDVEGDSLRIVGSCNGIVCFSRDSEGEGRLSESIVVYNPYTREHVDIPTGFGNVGVRSFGGCVSFGFDEVSKKFKVVVIYNLYTKNTDPDPTEAYSITVGESCWRKLDLSPELQFGRCNQKSIFSKGSFYWIMKKVSESTSEMVVLSMDIASEKFQVIYLEEPSLRDFPLGFIHYFLVNYGNSLALAVSDKQKQLKLWILTDAKTSCWSHQSTHDLGGFLEYKKDPVLYKCTKIEMRDPEYYKCKVDSNVGDDSLLVKYDYSDMAMRGPGLSHLVCYTPEKRHFGFDFASHSFPTYFDVFSFVPTILPLKIKPNTSGSG